jgi:hypothetical protein
VASILDLPLALSRRPTTVFLHGPSRDLVDLVTYGLVAWVGTEFSWIDIRLGESPSSATDPVRLGYIPRDRLIVVSHLDEMAPSHVSRDGVRSIIRSDEPLDAMEELSEFVRLPRAVQQALAKTAPGSRPGIMVLSNAQRLLPLYNASIVPEVLREVTELGTSIFVSFADEPPLGRSVFDFVLRVTSTGPEQWTDATIEFERAGGMHPSMRGRRVRLAEVDHFARLFDAVTLGAANGSKPD